MVKRHKSEAFAAIHETMEALHEIGAVDKKTMREFDEACLTPVRVLSPEEIKLIRLRENLSQPVFALYVTDRYYGATHDRGYGATSKWPKTGLSKWSN